LLLLLLLLLYSCLCHVVGINIDAAVVANCV